MVGKIEELVALSPKNELIKNRSIRNIVVKWEGNEDESSNVMNPHL